MACEEGLLNHSPGKKILFLRTDAATFDPRVLKEAASLKSLGYDVSVFGWDRRSEFPKDEHIRGVHFMRSRIPAPYGSKWLVAVLPMFWLRAIVKVMAVKPAAVHACDLDGLVPALILKPFMRFRIVYDIFDDFSEKIPDLPQSVRRFLQWLDRRARTACDMIVIADESRREFVRDVPEPRVTIIRNVPFGTRFSVNGKRSRVLRLCYAGVIHEHRGLKLIAEATRSLEGVETVFAGWIPRAEDREFLKMQAHLRFTGKLRYEESLKLISSSDVVLALYDAAVPINAHASSNKVFEAMSLKKPVITNWETTMAPLVLKIGCGVLVPYGDVRALRDAIVRLQNRALREKLGQRGYRAFTREYNWSLMEQKLKTMYSSLIATDF